MVKGTKGNDMKTRSLIGIGALAVAGIVGVACGGGGEMDGSGGAASGGTPGTGGGTPGTGGGTPGTGGAPGTGGVGSGGENVGGGAGEGGMGGMGGEATIACDGCAQLFVPLDEANTHTDFEI